MLALRARSVRSESAPHVDARGAASTLLPSCRNLRSASSPLHLNLLLLVLLLVLGLLLLAAKGIAGSAAWLLHLLHLLYRPVGAPNIGAGTARRTHRLIVEVGWHLLSDLLLHLQELLDLAGVGRLVRVRPDAGELALELRVVLRSKRALWLLLHHNPATSAASVPAHALLLGLAVLAASWP